MMDIVLLLIVCATVALALGVDLGFRARVAAGAVAMSIAAQHANAIAPVAPPVGLVCQSEDIVIAILSPRPESGEKARNIRAYCVHMEERSLSVALHRRLKKLSISSAPCSSPPYPVGRFGRFRHRSCRQVISRAPAAITYRERDVIARKVSSKYASDVVALHRMRGP